MDLKPITLKNAVMIVQELCVKSGHKPNFTEVEVPNQRPPVFKTSVEILFQGKTFSATADANTKKVAKIKCCENLLYEQMSVILDMNDPDIVKIFGIVDRKEEASAGDGSTKHWTPTSNVDADVPRKKKKSGDDVEMNNPGLVVDEFSEYAKKGNPITDLNVFCSKYGLEPANYEDGVKEGPPHRPIMSVKCNVADFTGVGVYLDKKSAKRIAADKVLTELKRRVDTGEIKPLSESTDMDVDMEDVENQETSPSKAEPVEQLRSLSLENVDGGVPRMKTFKDFINRPYLLKLKNNDFAILKTIGGPCVKEMINFSAEVNEKYPTIAKPLEQFKTWLMSHEKGITGFFSELKSELHMSVKINQLESANKEVVDEEGDLVIQYMTILSAEIPAIEDREPVIITYHDDAQEGQLNAMVELIMYLGLMTIS